MASATKPPAAAPAESVRVDIFDQAYHLRGTDPAYITRLAQYVDAKMRAVAGQTTTVDATRLAVLAALNIADEYDTLKRKQENGSSAMKEKAHQLADALDEVLGERRAG